MQKIVGFGECDEWPVVVIVQVAIVVQDYSAEQLVWGR